MTNRHPKAHRYRYSPNVLWFDHFCVIQKGKHFWGVYEDGTSTPITSGTTLQNASKKAKLLEIGYQIGRENEKESHYYS